MTKIINDLMKYLNSFNCVRFKFKTVSYRLQIIFKNFVESGVKFKLTAHAHTCWRQI